MSWLKTKIAKWCGLYKIIQNREEIIKNQAEAIKNIKNQLKYERSKNVKF